ncbi:trypsin 3A1-like [Bradysia coprophila]|uniref:trypsin 3A1-like n=1 Tax=Bradysia coprophila TaxID=38358 RepID=UPI00187DC8CC|nr:trypsin 3A1-like [Bradysia coprophila]
MRVSIILSTLLLSQASIAFGTYTVPILSNGEFLCNGAIIHNAYIVTTARCVAGAKQSQLIVRAGAEDCNKGDGVKTEVSKIITHKKFNESSHEYDIAILKLKGCLAISTSNIDVIPISEKRTSDEKCLLTGWIYSKSVPVHGSLQLKSVNVYRRSECERVAEVNITKRMFCAAGIANEKCIDFATGSPLVVQGKLVGIKCFGFQCNQNRPDVFTNVAVFGKFIRKVIKRLS